jgi:hypothetical protein
MSAQHIAVGIGLSNGKLEAMASESRIVINVIIDGANVSGH